MAAIIKKTPTPEIIAEIIAYLWADLAKVSVFAQEDFLTSLAAIAPNTRFKKISTIAAIKRMIKKADTILLQKNFCKSFLFELFDSVFELLNSPRQSLDFTYQKFNQKQMSNGNGSSL
ncbi:hypothetical protein GMAR_ORF170 [Golden Marseillevirus]|uniref:hypothetical protein n=1 Tax=Golden Marseillevirus TaxID=1720526 RepID=UPI000877ADF6|nr:hypothetical protein GMAR_ORF170 [Golden Marseillevirus]ALX27544.1 hypothetical protein GMAR_ORF170 [Golden Marseillevirus]